MKLLGKKLTSIWQYRFNQKKLNTTKSFLVTLLCLASLNLAWGQITESFETGLPTSYTSSTSYSLSSGTWTGSPSQIIRGTVGKTQGNYSLQLRNQTGAQITSPTLVGGVGTISFNVQASTASGGLQIRVSTDDGTTWTQVTGSPISFGTSNSSRIFTVNNAAVNKVQFYRTGATVYIDEVVITSFNSGSTVTFNSNGGSGSMANQTASSATNLTANTFSRTGYTFTSWNTVANGSGTTYADQSSFPFSASATLYAQWALITGPEVSLSESTISGLDYNLNNGPSDNQTFTASGTNLTANIVITAPTNFHISTNASSGFGSSLTLTQSSGTVNATTIYVRLIAGLNEDTYSGTLSAASTGATTQNITLSGVVSNECAKEDFSNLPTESSTSYAVRSWTGADNVTWTAEGARTDRTITGKAICFGTSGNRWVTSPSYSGGIGTLKFKYVREFTGTSARFIQVWVNGVQQGGNITVSNTSDIVVEYEETLNIGGNVVLEIRSTGSGQVKIDDISWSCYSAPCFTPSSHASSVASASVTTTSATINWSNGNGTERIVVMKAVSDVNANPINGTTYLSDANFGDGDQIGSGNFIIYKGTGSSVNVTGLSPGTVYFVKIFEFGCNPGSEEYFTTGTLGNVSFLTAPQTPQNFNSVCISNNEIDLTWDAPSGDFDGYMLVARETANELSVNSIDPSVQAHNLDYSSAPTYSAANPQGRILYIGSNTNATVTGLTNATDYTFRVYTYKSINANTQFSNSTSITRTTGLENVINTNISPFNEGAYINWTNPNGSCFDEVLIVVNTTPGIDFTPTGDGSAYTANTAYNGLNSVVYKGNDPSSVDITNLNNGDTYYFELFVRNGTQWSSGVEVSTTPADVTNLLPGDIAIIAINTNYLSSGGDDEICFIAFKDIKPGTSIDFTDNGYERVNEGLWGNTEGTIRITYNGVNDIIAGSPICIQGSGSQSSDFDVVVCGNNNNDWNISSLNGNFSADFNLNGSDQLWILQGGAWSMGQKSPAQHNASYSGNVVWGWTATGWEAAPGYASTSGSTLIQGTDCYNIDLNGKSNPDKIKYTGPLTGATQSEWIIRINNADNWTGYSSNANYNGVSGRNYSGECVSFSISTGGYEAGHWTGNDDTDWFNCGNWQNLSLPNTSVDVVIASSSNDPIIDGSAIAYCRNIEIESGADLTMNNENSELHVYGNWNNDAGSLKLQENNNATVHFFGANTKTISGSSTTRFQRLIIDGGGLVNIDADIRVGGNGLLRVTNGSELGATHSANNRRTLLIQGNTTLELVSSGVMNDNALDHLDIETGGNSSTATFVGNGETIKCWNFKSSKTNSGGVILENNTPLTCKNNLDLNKENNATFIDNGNTITVGDDLKLDGSSNNNYILTGTIIMNGVGSGSTSTIQNGSDAIVAHLNNLTINPPAGRPAVQFNPQTGTQNITIKGDLNIISGDVSLYGNNYLLNGDFSNTANLISGTSTVVFDNTNTDQNINGNVTTFYNLKLAKPGQILEMNEDVNVTNEVQLADGGVLRLNQHTLNLGSTGKLMNEDEDNYVFCSCPSAQIVAEGFISANTPANLGNLGLTIIPEIDMEHTQIVRMHEPKNLGDGTSIARIYTVSPTINADLNATLELQFFTHEKNGLNTELLTFFRSSDGGTTWSEIGGSFDEETNLLTVTEWQHFSPITGGEGNPSALPVALVYFNSECNTNQVTLNWQTASEWNASHFEIEKSNDGANWNSIGKVDAQGTSSQLVDYSFADVELNRGQVNYYRLVQVDFDGEYEVFGPISGTCKTNTSEMEVSVYPNPTNGVANLMITTDSAASIRVSIQTSTGQLIDVKAIDLAAGFNQVLLNTSNWADGLYIIAVQSENNTPKTIKLIKH